MENTLRTFYQEIRSKSKVGEYKDLLEKIEQEIDKFTPKPAIKLKSTVKSNKELWKIIESANWTLDHDFKRIEKQFAELPKKIRKQLFEFINTKHDDLYGKFEDAWLGNPGINVSDDGWSDLRAEVIGRGKEFYENITVKKLKEMAKNLDYTESFIYTIQTN